MGKTLLGSCERVLPVPLENVALGDPGVRVDDLGTVPDLREQGAGFGEELRGLVEPARPSRQPAQVAQAERDQFLVAGGALDPIRLVEEPFGLLEPALIGPDLTDPDGCIGRLYGVSDPQALAIYRQRYGEGIVRRSIGEEEADARTLYGVLADVGGTELVGPARELNPGTFYQPAAGN